jgi:hypothetical protein
MPAIYDSIQKHPNVCIYTTYTSSNTEQIQENSAQYYSIKFNKKSEIPESN